METYIIKHNLPIGSVKLSNKGKWFVPAYDVWYHEYYAKKAFLEMADLLTTRYPTKVFLRSTPLRGRIQVEIDGFYYYVELFIKKETL